MKSPQQCAILTVDVAPGTAERWADWMAAAWGVGVAQIEKAGGGPAWLEAYFPDDVQAILAGRVLSGRRGIVRVSAGRLQARDWKRYWKKNFKPRNVGSLFRICPPWQVRGSAGRLKLVINPGLGFGTGDHFTTRFCLEAIEDACRRRPKPASLLDVGTGSGILAIAGAKAGIRRVLAVDNDPQALDDAGSNLRLNRLGRAVKLKRVDVLAGEIPGGYDLVCANLYAPILIQAARALARAVRRRLVLSGIREFEADGVADAYLACGGRETVRDGDGEWCGLVFDFR